VFVRYFLNLTNSSTFHPLNFSSVYSVTLMNEANSIKTYSLTDRAVPLTHNGTRFVKLLRISKIEFDTLTVKIECHNLGHSYPTAEVFLSVESDLFAIRKADSHLIFMSGSILVLAAFLVQWKSKLRKARSVIVMLIFSIVAHQSITDFGYPQYLPLIEIIGGHLHRTFVRYVFANWATPSPIFAALFGIELCYGTTIDILGNSDPALIGPWVALLIGEWMIVLLKKGYSAVLCLTVCEGLAIYEFRANNPANWLVLPTVLPDLFAYCYAGLSLDFDERMDVEEFFSFGQIIRD
jgi:hypothetical protein